MEEAPIQDCLVLTFFFFFNLGLWIQFPDQGLNSGQGSERWILTTRPLGSSHFLFFLHPIYI